MIIRTAEVKDIAPFLKQLYIPKPDSHKGQNGRVLIIGGSSLFHSASIWSAETASHFVDIVHYASTKENAEILTSIKKKFRNGMVVSQKDIPFYIEEDDAILIGPGLLRGAINSKFLLAGRHGQMSNFKFSKILSMKDEPTFTYMMTKYAIEHFPAKRFVFDAGSVQMMEPDWLRILKEKAVVTPHQGEFEKLFQISVRDKSEKEKIAIVEKTAKKYNCVIVLKAVVDIISDGAETYVVKGGNAGLTKGGTGDILAGFILSLLAKNSAIVSSVLASFILKKTADELFLQDGYWYNNTTVIENIPKTLFGVLKRM